MKNLSLVLLLLALITSQQCSARDDSAWGVVKSTSAILLGTPVGFFTGMARGGTEKGAEYADSFSETMGDGTAANIFGKPLGFVGGVVAGGVTGAAKGIYNGIYYGVEEPFSKENFSVEGEFADFDPYHINEASDYGYSSI